MTKALRNILALLLLPSLLGLSGCCAPWRGGGEYQFSRHAEWQHSQPRDAHTSENDLVVRGQSPSGYNAYPDPYSNGASGANSPVNYGGSALGNLPPSNAPSGAAASPANVRIEGQQVQYQTQPQYVPVPSYAPEALPAEALNVGPNYPPPPGYLGPGGMFAPPPAGWLPQDGFVNPEPEVDIIATVQETTTGRFMIGAGVNSDAGLVGNILIEEQNFDITRVPGSWREVLNGSAFRGAGQRLRLEAVPGTELQRYLVSFSEPYLFDSPVSFGLSGFYYTRNYRDWDEERLGGRVSLGYFFRPDLAGTVAFRGEQIDISDPAVPTPNELARVVGENTLYSVRVQMTHDTRDNTYMPSAGSYFEVAFEQGMGDFTYPRIELDARRYFVMRQRPDRSGRHVLGLSGRVGWSGTDTPLYENFFAGGFSTIRGFDFRGASPLDMGVRVGGEFQLLTSVEYRFPITANDMVQGSFFVDAGTVEPRIDDFSANDFRVTPGFELRVAIPALGPVPLAVGIGVPIAHAPGDDIQNFHFFIGVSR